MKDILAALFWLFVCPAALIFLFRLMPIRTECHCWDNGTVKTSIPYTPETWEECRLACREGQA